MKKLLNVIGVILTVVIIIWDTVEFLALPALFVIIGLLNAFPWQYYAITVGGYFAIFAIAEIILHFVFKSMEKKYISFFERKLKKIIDRFSSKD